MNKIILIALLIWIFLLSGCCMNGYEWVRTSPTHYHPKIWNHQPYGIPQTPMVRHETLGGFIKASAISETSK